MPAEREFIEQYITTSSSGQATLARFFSECFNEFLLTSEHVASSALAAHFAAKLAKSGNAAELQALMVLEYLKSWVEGEAGKIAHARNSLFAGNYEGVEISGEARLTSHNREATETHKKVETWKAAVELAKIFHRP